MKGFVFIAALLLSGFLQAQHDSTVYRFGLPISEDDTAKQFLQSDVEPRNELTAVPITNLPDEVREALESGKQYTGWRDSTIWFEKNTRHYLVPIKGKDGIRVFGLNENGDVVTFDLVTESP